MRVSRIPPLVTFRSTLQIAACPHLLGNGTVWAHTFLTRSGNSPDPNDANYDRLATVGRSYPMVTHYPRKKSAAKKKLLGGEAEEGEEVVGDEVAQTGEGNTTQWVQYWRPTLRVNYVDDYTHFKSLNGIPPMARESMRIDATTGG